MKQVKLQTAEGPGKKDGKINDYNGVFAFFLHAEKTKHKASDKLHYLVVLLARRQLLLKRSKRVSGGREQEGQGWAGGSGGPGCQEGHGDGR